MGRPVLKVGNYSAEDIKAMFGKDERYTIGLRLYAVYQVALGQPSRKLEGVQNTSFKQITNWVHRFEKEGIDGLRDKEGRGRIARLNKEQREGLSLLLNEQPDKHGYHSATWTGPMVIEWIEKTMEQFTKKHRYTTSLNHWDLVIKKAKGYFLKEMWKNKTFLKRL